MLQGNIKFIKDIGVLAVSTILSRIFLFSRDVLLASILGPATYGAWTQIVVLLSYSLHLPLGFQHLLSRNIPFSIAEKNHSEVKKIQDTAFIVSMITATLAAISLVLSALIIKDPFFNLSLFGLVSLGLLILVQQLNAFYSVILRAHQRFNIFSVGSILVAFISLPLAAILANYFGIIGIIFSLIVAFILVNIYWAIQSTFTIKAIHLDFYWLKKSLNITFPLFAIGVLGVLIISVDRLAVVFLYDKESIGYYGFAFIITQAIFLAVTPIIQAISPRMMMAYGNHKDPKRLTNYFFILTQGMSVIVTIMIGIIYLIANIIINFFLPEYLPAVSIIKILLIGAAFNTLAIGSNTFTIGVNKQANVLRLQIFIITLQIIMISLLAYNKGSIETIAKGMAFSYFLYATLAFYIAKEASGDSFSNRIKSSLGSMFLVMHLLLFLVLIDTLNTSFGCTLLSITLSLLAWLVISTPSIIYLYIGIKNKHLVSSGFD